MGVNDVRPADAKHLGEFAQRQPIVQRMNGSDEMSREPQAVRLMGEGGFERAFRTGGGSADEINLKTRLALEAEDG